MPTWYPVKSSGIGMGLAVAFGEGRLAPRTCGRSEDIAITQACIIVNKI